MSSTQQALSPSATESRDARTGRGGNPVGRFIREVIEELRKVVVPTRREMVGYTVTVLGFVFVMILIVFGLDIAFGWLAHQIFVGGSAG